MTATCKSAWATASTSGSSSASRSPNTGCRYLDGYSSDEDQYTALMNADLSFSQQYHLMPGIALTDAQMAQLTSDIVWLVGQAVQLPDGSTQRVLAPTPTHAGSDIDSVANPRTAGTSSRPCEEETISATSFIQYFERQM